MASAAWRPAIAACFAASLVSLPLAAADKHLFTVKAPPPDAHILDDNNLPPLAKLTPDLRAVVATRSKAVGLAGGRLILAADTEHTTKDLQMRAADMIRGAEISPLIPAVREGPRPPGPITRLDRLIAVMSGELPQEQLAGIKVVRRYEPGRFVVLESPGGFTADQISKVAEQRAVRLVQPNYHYFLAADSLQVPTPASRIWLAESRIALPFTPSRSVIPNDARFSELWGMQRIAAPQAWSKVHDSSVLVALLDSGIEFVHEDLSGSARASLSKDFTTDMDATDKDGHGTRCAGIIGGQGNNGKGVVGVCWSVPIMSAKVSGKSGYVGDDVAVTAIDDALKKKARILSISWSGPNTSPCMKAAMTRAEACGVLVVAVAGNNYSDTDIAPQYPACFANANIISVLAVDPDDTLRSSSNYGKTTVFIGAPGTNILSTDIGNSYKSAGGTSYAAPHVAGAAALIWAHPDYASKSAVEVKALIRKNARAVPSLANLCVANGMLDIGFLAK